MWIGKVQDFEIKTLNLNLVNSRVGEEPDLPVLSRPPSPTLEFEKHRATPGLPRRREW